MGGKMRLERIVSCPIQLMVMDDRKYVTASGGEISLCTNEGTIRIHYLAGVLVDGRSGGALVDLLMPNVGDQNYRRAWFAHDLLFCNAAKARREGWEPVPSFGLSNDLFRQSLALKRTKGGAGLSSIRAWLAWRGVQSWFGEQAWERADRSDKINYGKIEVRWDAR